MMAATMINMMIITMMILFSKRKRNMPEKNNLELMFSMILEASRKLQKKKNADGLSFWHKIKKELGALDNNQGSGWKRLSKKTVDKYMSLPEYTKNGYGTESLIELHHFIIQQVRIPTTEKQTIRKIMQLALNIGQFIGKVTSKYKKELGYASTNLDQLDTYVKKSDIKKTMEYLRDKRRKRSSILASSVFLFLGLKFMSSSMIRIACRRPFEGMMICST